MNDLIQDKIIKTFVKKFTVPVNGSTEYQKEFLKEIEQFLTEALQQVREKTAKEVAEAE